MSRNESLNIGDTVRIIGSMVQYTIISGPNAKNQFCITHRATKLWIEEEKLIKLQLSCSQEFQRPALPHPEKRIIHDLHGLRAQEALEIIQKVIDSSIAENISQIEFIHGIGEGKLKEVLHNFLKTNRQVLSYAISLSNPGSTIVNL